MTSGEIRQIVSRIIIVVSVRSSSVRSATLRFNSRKSLVIIIDHVD